MEAIKKNTCLFLFTNEYPCSKTLEPYIEHELPFLAKAFQQIIIIPSHFGEIKKEIPDNVQVVNIFDASYFKTNLANKLSGFFSFIKFLISKRGNKVSIGISIRNFISDFKSFYNAIITGNAIVNYCNSNRIDIHNCSFYSYWFFHPVITLGILKRKGIIKKFISRGHLGDLYIDQFPELRKFYDFKIENVDKLCVISRHAYDYLVNLYPHYSSKFVISRLAVKDMGINPLPQNEPVFVSCSTYSERKRVDLLAELLANTPFKLTWIHFGYIPDNVISKYQSHFKKSVSLVNAIFKGDVPNDQVMEFYKTQPVSAIINLSTSEGLPFSLIEANSFGIPVIATNVNGTPDIATKKNGFLLPISFSQEMFFECLNEIIKQGEKFRKGARELFIESYQAEKNYPELISLLLNG